MGKTLMDYMDKAKGIAIELDPEDMDKVSGGVMTKDEKKLLVSGLKMAKSAGLDLQEVLSYVPTYFKQLSPQHPNVTQSEVISFINSVWPKL